MYSAQTVPHAKKNMLHLAQQTGMRLVAGARVVPLPVTQERARRFTILLKHHHLQTCVHHSHYAGAEWIGGFEHFREDRARKEV